MKRTLLLISAVILSVVFCTQSTKAQLIVDPVGKTEVGYFDGGGILLRSTIEYDDEEISRTILGVYGAYGLNDIVDAYASLGISAMVDPEGWDETGRGFMLAGGARAFIWQNGPLAVYAYGQLQYLTETYGEYSEKISDEGVSGEITVEADGNILELMIGAMAEYQLNDQLSLYGGLELIPFSSGEAEYSTDSSASVESTGLPLFDALVDDAVDSLDYSESADVERDTPAVIRAGAHLNMDGWWLRGEIALGGETAIGVGAGMNF